MNTIKRLRINYSLTTTLVAAIFLAMIFGGLIGLLQASDTVLEMRALERALDAYESYEPNVSQMSCVLFYVNDSGKVIAKPEDFEHYGKDAENIINDAIKQDNGKYHSGKRFFIVASKRLEYGTLYAIYDRTLRREELVNTVLEIVLIYACSIVLVGIIAYLFSAKTLRPVDDVLKKQRDFIADASHELKTPLTIISTNLSVIKSEPQSTVTDNEKWIESINAQISRMQGLIQNMLELSKLEHSQIPKERVDMSQLTQGACLAFEAVCFEKQVELITDIRPDIYIAGDKNALERLIVILLDNAIKYCGQNGKIGCVLASDNQKMRLSVMNTGDVISKEDEKHVFDRFYRSDGARQNTDNQSFGLGLSIAAATTNAHGGKISCHGVEDKGTVFEVVFPILKNKTKKKS